MSVGLGKLDPDIVRMLESGIATPGMVHDAFDRSKRAGNSYMCMIISAYARKQLGREKSAERRAGWQRLLKESEVEK